MKNSTKVSRFYDQSTLIYHLAVYIHGKSFGNHYGFWENGTKTIAEANLNENNEIIKGGLIGPKSIVLDAGCGIGRSAIYIAQKTGAKVYGISISSREISAAIAEVEKAGLGNQVIFSNQNYCQTDFPDNHFDVVYGIESICYAAPKKSLLQEAYRILKPRGRLVISDGYKKFPRTDKDKRIIKDFMYGFCLEEALTSSEMIEEIIKAGFTKVKAISKIKEVEKSVKYFARIGKVLKLITFPIKRIHPAILFMYRNGVAADSAYKGIKADIADYCIHIGTKP